MSAPSLDYGKRHEVSAKSKYLEMFPSRHLHECGLVINRHFAFLGATPDGKVCDEQTSGIIEIKCPFTARQLMIAQATEQIQGFFLEKSDNVLTLRKDHPYYAHIQGQLMVTGCEFCEFIVYTQKDLFTQRITPDLPFMSQMLVKLASFFRDYGMPFLQSKMN